MADQTPTPQPEKCCPDDDYDDRWTALFHDGSSLGYWPESDPRLGQWAPFTQLDPITTTEEQWTP